MSRQDRQGARTPADLERKYNFGQAFSNMEQESTRHGEQISNLAQMQSQFMANTNAEFGTQGENVSKAQKDIVALAKRMAAVEGRITTAEQTALEQKKALDDSGLWQTAAEMEISALAQRIFELEQDRAVLYQRIETLEEAVSAISLRLSDLEQGTTASE